MGQTGSLGGRRKAHLAIKMRGKMQVHLTTGSSKERAGLREGGKRERRIEMRIGSEFQGGRDEDDGE